MAETISARASVTKLHGLLANMFDLVDEQLASALNAAFIGDEQLSQSVQEADDKVDNGNRVRVAREFLAVDGLTDTDRQLIITPLLK